jgi:hypothetical protein
MSGQWSAANAQGILEGQHHQILAIHNDVRMLRYYGIKIPSVFDLQNIISNPTNNPILSLYDLSNATIGTNLEKKKRNKNDKTKDKKKDDEE